MASFQKLLYVVHLSALYLVHLKQKMNKTCFVHALYIYNWNLEIILKNVF